MCKSEICKGEIKRKEYGDDRVCRDVLYAYNRSTVLSKSLLQHVSVRNEKRLCASILYIIIMDVNLL